MNKENLFSKSVILGSILTLIITVGVWKYQRYVENEDSRKITVELLSSEIEGNLYDTLGDDNFNNIKKVEASLVNQEATTLFSIRGTQAEFYNRNSNNLTLLNPTTIMAVIGFYHLLKGIDEDTVLISTFKDRDNLIEAYKNLIEDTRKARTFGSLSLALLKYYYNPEYLKELVFNSENGKTILEEIKALPPNATTTAEKILQGHSVNIIDEVFIKFLFLKSGQMKLIDKDQGIYQHI